MKKTKILIILLMSFIMIGNINTIKSYAADEITVAKMDVSDIFNKGKTFISQGKSDEKISEDSAIEEFVPVGQILVVVANGVIVVVAAIMGIKWITAKPDQQAKLKEQLIGLAVAIFVIYGAVGIWNLVKGIMSDF